MAGIGDEGRGDIPFYVAHARDAHGAVLVAGCGAGRVLLPVAKAGADADGFDAEPAAVEAARQALNARGLVAEVWRDDLTTFSCRRRYAGLLAAGRAFDAMGSAADFAAALRACRAALAPGAWLVGDIAGPGAADYAPRWTTDELVTLLLAAGFTQPELWGDFHATPLHARAHVLVWRASVVTIPGEHLNPA